MIPSWLLLLPLPLQVALVSGAGAGVDKTFGVKPELLAKYVPLANGNWKCLDGSKEIPWGFVNDDSCDCPDGSDEPGTGACPNTTFYCQNKGHIGKSLPSTRVRDGICDTECCDGSDERPGVCPNKCKEIGEAYRKKRDAELKIQRTGSKIRSTYIQYAHKEQKRLEAVIEASAKEIEAQEKQVARLRDVAERTESLSKAALEHKKQSPLYQSLIDHSEALKALQEQHKKHLEREKALGDILSSLRTGYNPNYQDMAVLEAVRGWEELAGLPHINDVGKDTTEESTSEEDKKVEEEKKEDENEEEWTEERLEAELGELLKTDYVGLLLEHDEHVRTPIEEPSVLFDLTSYLPDSFIPQYEDIKDGIVSFFQTLGIIRADADEASSAESSKAHQALTDAENALKKLQDERQKAEDDAKEIFNVHGFGKEGEWKKLDGLCLEKEQGDYIYELCFFNEAKQKPKNGGSNFSLGRFDSWNPSSDVQPGEPSYYKKQMYKHGTRCWNGPERSVVLELSCGTENALLGVAELEKCEYQYTATTPALCLPVTENASGSREEL